MQMKILCNLSIDKTRFAATIGEPAGRRKSPCFRTGNFRRKGGSKQWQVVWWDGADALNSSEADGNGLKEDGSYSLVFNAVRNERVIVDIVESHLSYLFSSVLSVFIISYF